MSEAALVNELQKLQPKLKHGHGNIAEMRQATTTLARLATALHQKGELVRSFSS